MTTYAPLYPVASRPRSPAAVVLRATSATLARLARRLEARAWDRRRAERDAARPLFEFHAEAGAPEGALYVDGRYVGLLPTARL